MNVHIVESVLANQELSQYITEFTLERNLTIVSSVASVSVIKLLCRGIHEHTQVNSKELQRSRPKRKALGTQLSGWKKIAKKTLEKCLEESLQEM